MSALLNAAARAFAMTALSDGKIDPVEERRFVSFVAGEPALRSAAQSDIAAAWTEAVKEVQASSSFGGPLVMIRTEARSQGDKLLMMRAAQTAVAADQKLELQENVAVQKLAEALGLDPESY
jgi:tellurite resistance protein